MIELISKIISKAVNTFKLHGKYLHARIRGSFFCFVFLKSSKVTRELSSRTTGEGGKQERVLHGNVLKHLK